MYIYICMYEQNMMGKYETYMYNILFGNILEGR